MFTRLQRITPALIPKTRAGVLALGLLLALLAWVLTGVVWEDVASRRGLADAQADIARGQLAYHLRGKPAAWERSAIETAQSEFGIQLVRTGACVGTGPDCAYDLAYNRVMQKHFDEQFGFDPVERSRARAREEWERVHALTLKGSETAPVAEPALPPAP